VTQQSKILWQILRGQADNNISFSDLCSLLAHLGFAMRIKGDHHIFHKTGVVEIINLQPNGNQAKAYQVKQVRNLILEYRLGNIDE